MKCRLLFIVSIISVLISCHKNDSPPEVLPVVIPHPEKPNVILIIGDDIGYEIPTCNGGQSYQTPNLDNMAAAGIRFQQCYSSPLCSPSRIMLLTGKYSFRNYYSWGILNTNEKTIGNLLKDNGYKTMYAGKWQLDGGEASIKNFGFDKYTVFLPFKTEREDEAGSRYKNPSIYDNGNFLSTAQVEGKYSDDIFSDSVKSFIKQNINNPFFVYYAMNLCHAPFGPTPDDKSFATWDPNNPTRPSFFPEMVSYMDKKIGEINALIAKYSIDRETIVIFLGDNGSPEVIESVFNGITITGGKTSTTTYGTHVPLIMSWPGKIMPGRLSDNLFDFTDFLPTIADITNTSITAEYGQIDGHSIYSILNGSTENTRDWIFNHYFLDTDYNRIPSRWVQNRQYKLYEDNKGFFHAPGFYNLQNDIMEINPLLDNQLTPAELITRQNFQQVLDSLK